MALPVFNFKYHSVQDEWPTDSLQVKFGGGYSFASKPKGAPQITFHLFFPCMWWWTDKDGIIDRVFSPPKTPGINLAALDDFYAAVELWQPFTYYHQTRGQRTVRFAKPFVLPKNVPGGLIWHEGYRGHICESFTLDFIDNPS